MPALSSYPPRALTNLNGTDVSGNVGEVPLNYGRNILINGDFRVNQRGYLSTATLAAGSYGHDRWKGGAGGGDYSFTQNASSTTITIAASKTLIQVVEDKNVVGGTYTLSWTGTCQARYAINSATPAGSYASSPIVITGQTAGTTMSVEFGNGASTGTLGTVQLELGSVPTAFELRLFGAELLLCQRYYFKTFPYGTTPAQGLGNFAGALQYIVVLAGANYYGQGLVFPAKMQAAPTVTFFSPGLATSKWYNVSQGLDSGNSGTFVNLGDTGFMAINNPQAAGDAVSNTVNVHCTAEAEL